MELKAQWVLYKMLPSFKKESKQWLFLGFQEPLPTQRTIEPKKKKAIEKYTERKERLLQQNNEQHGDVMQPNLKQSYCYH